MPPYQIFQCDVEEENSSGTYETLELAKTAWADLIAKQNEMSLIAMELVDDELEVIETYYFI